MLGRESATEGASADASGGRRPLIENDGSNEDVIIKGISIIWNVFLCETDGGVDSFRSNFGYAVNKRETAYVAAQPEPKINKSLAFLQTQERKIHSFTHLTS